MRRHDLAFVRPEAWRALLATRGALEADPLVAPWVDNGWPLIARRAMPGEERGVALGLPLPPSAGRRRLAFLMQPEDIVATARPPALSAAACVAPHAWGPTLERVAALDARHAADARVFGSLAWQALTGLDYLTDRSDLDFVLQIRGGTDLVRLSADLAAIEAAAPMRLDGELVGDDGAAVNWRELHAGAREVLVKTQSGACLLDARLFHLTPVPS